MENGQAHEAPDKPVNAAPDKAEDAPVVVKIGDKEVSQADLQALITGDAADSIKVDVGDGKVVTLKTLRESARRFPEAERILKEGRDQLEKERTQLLEDVKAEHNKLNETMRSASTEQLQGIATAIQEAATGRKAGDPFATRQSAVAYITEKMQTEGWNAGVADLVNQLFEARDASKTVKDELLKKFEKDIADLKEQAKQAELKAFSAQETRDIQAAYPEYNPSGRDPFSLLVRSLLTEEKPDQDILGGVAGIDTPPVEVAKKVKVYLSKTARATVKAEDEAEQKRKETDAAAPAGRGSFKVPDDLQDKLAKATTLEEIREIRKEVAARSR